jgi:flavin-binding protein dodecin
MKAQVYKLTELTGTSTRSMDDIVDTALKRTGNAIQRSRSGWLYVKRLAMRHLSVHELRGHGKWFLVNAPAWRTL